MNRQKMKKVTDRQRETMIEILEQNLQTHKGRFSSSVCDEDRQELWQIIADTLNSGGEGPIKSWQSWRKSFADWKCSVKSKLREINRVKNGTGGGPQSTVHLTSLEHRVAVFIPKVQVEGIPSVREAGFANKTQAIEGQMTTMEKSEQDKEDDGHESKGDEGISLSPKCSSTKLYHAGNIPLETSPEIKKPSDKKIAIKHSKKRSHAQSSSTFVSNKSSNNQNLVQVLSQFAEGQSGQQDLLQQKFELKQQRLNVEKEAVKIKKQRLDVEANKVAALKDIATAMKDIAYYLKNQD